MPHSLKIIKLFLIVILVLVPLAGAHQNLPKLQVGVKKRGKCTKKSTFGDRISVHYDGRLTDGTQFDSSRKRGEPFEFVLGQGQVIKGWDEGLLQRCPGDNLKLKIPPHLAYGERGSPPTIPPNSDLVFEIEVMSITPEHEDL